METRTRGEILLLEDDRLYSETLCDFLEEEGFAVEACYDPHTAFERAYARRFDLYLFDINLPFVDGLETFAQLRQGGDDTPVVFLTSREDRESLLRGFALGAHDYLRKPVDLLELSARIDALLRRRRGAETIDLGECRLERSRRRLFCEGQSVKLGPKLYDLLELLVLRAPEVVTKEEIFERLWDGEESNDGALRVYIARLKKLFPHALENVRGVGYRFHLPKERP